MLRCPSVGVKNNKEGEGKGGGGKKVGGEKVRWIMGGVWG
jgi:hypothetical protein